MADVTLHLGDCLEYMRGMQAGSVDAVVTDPPYGISDAPFTGGIRSGKRTGGDNVWHPPSDWDKEINPSWCSGVCRVSNVVAWMGHWRKRFEIESLMEFPIRAEIVWAKNCHMGPPCPVSMRDERIWLFSKSEINGRTFETSVWDVPIIPTWEYREHKNEKPVALMKRLIRFLTDPGDTIFDPFMGSGTTGVAAIQLGRRFIGCEIDPGYFAIAEKRIHAASLQPQLFPHEAQPQEKQMELNG